VTVESEKTVAPEIEALAVLVSKKSAFMLAVYLRQFRL
jgi:hypothetical protein